MGWFFFFKHRFLPTLKESTTDLVSQVFNSLFYLASHLTQAGREISEKVSNWTRDIYSAEFYCGGCSGGGGTWTWVCAWPRPFYAWGTVGTHLTMVNLPNP